MNEAKGKRTSITSCGSSCEPVPTRLLRTSRISRLCVW